MRQVTNQQNLVTVGSTLTQNSLLRPAQAIMAAHWRFGDSDEYNGMFKFNYPKSHHKENRRIAVNVPDWYIQNKIVSFFVQHAVLIHQFKINIHLFFFFFLFVCLF